MRYSKAVICYDDPVTVLRPLKYKRQVYISLSQQRYNVHPVYWHIPTIFENALY